MVDRGTSSMRVLLESMLFSIGPAMFDVIAAASLLYSKQAWIAAIVLVSVLFYVPVTIIITEYRGEMRREMNMLDNKVGSKVRPRPRTPALLEQCMPGSQTPARCTLCIPAGAVGNGAAAEYQSMTVPVTGSVVLSAMHCQPLSCSRYCGVVIWWPIWPCVPGHADRKRTATEVGTTARGRASTSCALKTTKVAAFCGHVPDLAGGERNGAWSAGSWCQGLL